VEAFLILIAHIHLRILILIIDDDNSIRKFLELSLENAGYQVFTAPSGEQAFFMVNNHNPDMIILDLNLPDISGYEILQKIRKDSPIPIIMLTIEDSDKEKVKLLDAGADDYLTKPFNIQELLARIRVVIRHCIANSEETIFNIGDVVINLNLRTVTKNQKSVKLTATEYEILSILAKNSGKIVTQQQLLRSIWGPTLMEQTHYLRIYVAQLRKKIEINPSQPQIIITETGIGYRFMRG
jgi:two-component system KDP operon response regulator KdpE